MSVISTELLEINPRQGTGDSFKCIFFFPKGNGPKTAPFLIWKTAGRMGRASYFEILEGEQMCWGNKSETKSPLSAQVYWLHSAPILPFPSSGKWALEAPKTAPSRESETMHWPWCPQSWSHSKEPACLQLYSNSATDSHMRRVSSRSIWLFLLLAFILAVIPKTGY